MRDLKTTTQLLLVVLSNKLSANCGMFTFISFVHWIKSAIKQQQQQKDLISSFNLLI